MPFIKENELGFLDMGSGFAFKKDRTIPPQEYGLEWNSLTDIYTRLGKAQGKVAVTGGQNDFNDLFPWVGMRRCCLKDDGTVNYYLHPNNSKYKETWDGSDGYQQWNSYPQSPVLLSQYPYQIVFGSKPNESSSESIYLATAEDILYRNNVQYLVTASGYYNLYKLVSNTWSFLGNSIYTTSITNNLATLYQSNTNVYSDYRCTIVSFNKTTTNTIDTANLTGADGQVVVEMPKFWYKCEYPDANTFRFWISDKAKSGYEIHPAFYRDRNGDSVAEEVDFRYLSAFEGYYNTTTTKLESRSGVAPKVSQTISTFRTQAQARGNGWGIQDVNIINAIRLLYLIEYGHFDSQTKIGKGITGGSAVATTGRTLTLGNKSGNESNIGTDGLKAMSYRGIENIYGNMFKLVDGLVSDASRNILIGNKAFSDVGTGYTSYSVGLVSNINGYISKIAQNKNVPFIPTEVVGSATTKLYDNGSISASCVALQGGAYNSNTLAGMFMLKMDVAAASTSNTTYGSRLAY